MPFPLTTARPERGRPARNHRHRHVPRIEPLAHRDLLSGGIAEYVLPNSGSGPTGVAPAPDGNIWFAEYAADKIGRVNLNSVPIDITEFAVGPRRFVAAAGARPRIP